MCLSTAGVEKLFNHPNIDLVIRSPFMLLVSFLSLVQPCKDIKQELCEAAPEAKQELLETMSDDELQMLFVTMKAFLA